MTVDRLAGLAGRQPGLAALMAIFMFSLTGIPPLAGFFGKLYVFGAAVQAGLTRGWPSSACSTAPIAAYYYLRVTVAMFMSRARRAELPPAGKAGCAGVGGLIMLSAVAHGRAGHLAVPVDAEHRQRRGAACDAVGAVLASTFGC